MADKKPDAWTGKSRGGVFGYKFFIFLIRKVGLGSAYLFLALVVVYFIPCAPRATAAIWFYNRRVMGYRTVKSIRLLFVHYYRFGQALIDKIAVGAGMQDKFRYEFDNYPEFLNILNSGSGVVMIGAHVGNWEAGSHFFGDYAKKMNIVLYDAEYERIKRALDNNSNSPEFNVIAVNTDGLDNVLRIKNALDKGEYVCFQGDRFVDEENTVEGVFLGRKARFPLGPFLVGARMRVPVVFYYAVREPGRRYRFHFVKAQACGGIDRRCNPEKILLDEYIEATERIVRNYPQQWFNFYKFWE